MLSRFEENMKRATAASLAQLKVEAEKAPTLRRRPVVAPGPYASRNTAKKPISLNNVANALKKLNLSKKRKRSSSFENALEAIAEQERAEALVIKRKEASIAAAAKKAEAAKIVAAKKAEEAIKKASLAVPRKRPVVAPRRPSRSSSLEKALKAIENANAKAKKTEESNNEASNNEASNNEKEALAFQRVLEESMMKFKINNKKNK
jgi:Mg-chelatase subunit ChlI